MLPLIVNVNRTVPIILNYLWQSKCFTGGRSCYSIACPAGQALSRLFCNGCKNLLARHPRGKRNCPKVPIPLSASPLKLKLFYAQNRPSVTVAQNHAFNNCMQRNMNNKEVSNCETVELRFEWVLGCNRLRTIASACTSYRTYDIRYLRSMKIVASLHYVLDLWWQSFIKIRKQISFRGNLDLGHVCNFPNTKH